MTQIDNKNGFETPALDEAMAAILSEEVPPGPPASVACQLTETWHQSRKSSTRRRFKPQLVSLTLAASVILGCTVFWHLLGTPGNIALADVAKEFHKAKSIQFRIVHYVHVHGDANPNAVWRTVSCEECSFKSPGFRREVAFNDYGIPTKITTGDAVRGITLELRVPQMAAKLTELGPPTAFELKQGFPSNLTMLEGWLVHGKVMKELGTREIQGRNVLGLRVAHGEREADFWVDRQTRQIVRFLEPTTAVYDPENDPVAKNPIPPNDKVGAQEIKGWIWTDIIYDPPLDDSQFVYTPPREFIVERLRFREPTEKDLLEWLEVFAQVRGGVFTDDENSPLSSPELGRKIQSKPAAQRSPWEEKLIRGYIQKEEVPLKGKGHSVLVRFYSMYRDTWHYQGKGVRLGDAQTPVCWYRTPGAPTYRVVYGDLSVRDVWRQMNCLDNHERMKLKGSGIVNCTLLTTGSGLESRN